MARDGWGEQSQRKSAERAYRPFPASTSKCNDPGDRTGEDQRWMATLIWQLWGATSSSCALSQLPRRPVPPSLHSTYIPHCEHSSSILTRVGIEKEAMIRRSSYQGSFKECLLWNSLQNFKMYLKLYDWRKNWFYTNLDMFFYCMTIIQVLLCDVHYAQHQIGLLLNLNL